MAEIERVAECHCSLGEAAELVPYLPEPAPGLPIAVEAPRQRVECGGGMSEILLVSEGERLAAEVVVRPWVERVGGHGNGREDHPCGNRA